MIYIYSLIDRDFSKTHSQASLHTPSEHKDGNESCPTQGKQQRFAYSSDTGCPSMSRSL